SLLTASSNFFSKIFNSSAISVFGNFIMISRQYSTETNNYWNYTILSWRQPLLYNCKASINL
ncbi:MAG: hypothetical protein ABIQ07_04550, partial [Ginsengibacter sp.]